MGVAQQIRLPKNIKTWLFIESLLDVLVSVLYRLVASLRDILKAINPIHFFAKLTAYLINKIARVYLQFYPPKAGHGAQKSKYSYIWPFALVLIIGNLIFDLAYNYDYVFRILNGAFTWLSSPMVIVIASISMLLSSLNSLYSNSLSWYGIAFGGKDLKAYDSLINTFIIITSLSDATVFSLYFMLTTQLSLLAGIPFCLILYFIPPFLQNYVDMTVRKNLISKHKSQNLHSKLKVFIALYVTSAQVVGMCFQIASIMIMLKYNLFWLPYATISIIGISFVAFFAIQVLISSSYTWGQYIWGENFLDQKTSPLNSNDINHDDVLSLHSEDEQKSRIDLNNSNPINGAKRDDIHPKKS